MIHDDVTAPGGAARARWQLTACSLFALLLMAAPAAAQTPPQTFVASVQAEFYGPPWDFGRHVVRSQIHSPHYVFRCVPPQVTRSGPTLVVIFSADDSGVAASCGNAREVLIETLPAGSYRLEAHLVRADGLWIDMQRRDFEVRKRATQCNIRPVDHHFNLFFGSQEAALAFSGRFAREPELRSALGLTHIGPPPEVTRGHIEGWFPPLADPLRVLAQLQESGEFLRIGWPTTLGCWWCVRERAAIEFYHADHDRYFFTHDPAEIAVLDAGTPIAGWKRTGESFRVINSLGLDTSMEGVRGEVYRFWNDDAGGKPSHFFTLDQRECAVLRDRPAWKWHFEGTTFWAYHPQGGTCDGRGLALHRLYNNGLGGAPSHRYTTRFAVVDEMVAKGWVHEGPAMCVAGP